MPIPNAHHELPDLMQFINEMQHAYDAGKFDNWQDFIVPVREWYTPDRLQAIDDKVMGWTKMATYQDQQTLIHLTAVLVALFGLPEYQALPEADQNLVLWIALYHDVAKEPEPRKRDLTHGFRSAGTCGVGIMEAEFTEPIDPLLLYTWHGKVMNARVFDKAQNDFIQDNTMLPEIMEGIDNLFGGRDSEAGLIICGVLFHMSITVAEDWPQAAPLTDDETKRYISPRLLPLLRAMMIADGMAWGLFEPERRQHEQNEVRQTLAQVGQLLGIS